jgi:uncharacterized membrane protein
MCQGKQIGAADLQLQPGTNPVNVSLRMTSSGVQLIELRASGEGRQEVLFAQAVLVRHPRVLYLTYASKPASQLLEILKRADIDVQVLRDIPIDLTAGTYDAVLLDDYPGRDLLPWENRILDQYVTSGGGLIFIAGEHNSHLVPEPRTQFEKLLPVRADPDVPNDSMALVLVLDKSGSMTGEKIAKAREAAIASLGTLRPEDRVGIIAFNDAFHWVAPIAPASEVPRLASLISAIDANGSTRIYPPTRAALDAILKEKVTRRHIVLLTDGISLPEDLPDLLRSAAAERVTISTIGLGTDVYRPMLEEIAQTTQGKSYFVDRVANLPQVMSEEVRNAKISQIREEPVGIAAVQPAESTDGIDFVRAPQLLGFVRAKAKNGAETILRLPGGEPALVRWQFGLGRVVAFLSDSGGRWAADWVKWQGYGKFWPQMVRDVSSRDAKGRIAVTAGSSDGEELVTYDVPENLRPEFDRTARAAGKSVLRVEGPGGLRESFPLEETAPNHYEARTLLREKGMYRLLLPGTDAAQTEIGFYRDSEETKPKLVNESLLREVSEVTGGTVNPDFRQLLGPEGSLFLEPYALWPYLLGLALVLNFLELAIRKELFTFRAPRILRRRSSSSPARTGASIRAEH